MIGGVDIQGEVARSGAKARVSDVSASPHWVTRHSKGFTGETPSASRRSAPSPEGKETGTRA